MLPHTGLFLLGKVALQMRIRRRLNISDGLFCTTHFCFYIYGYVTSTNIRKKPSNRKKHMCFVLK